MEAPDSIRTQSPGTSVDLRDSAGSSTSMIVESSRLLPWLMLIGIMAGFAVAFSSFTFYQLTRSEREFRLVQLQLMDQNAILIREGLKQPADATNGPAGNYQYKPREKR